MWLSRFLAVACCLLPVACGFQLRTDPEVGIRKLFISAVGPSAVQADVRRVLAAGPTRMVATRYA